ncbi:MAG: copper resistance protein B [Acidobacteria bacterium]|nr:copper resistance protein B [Acidobacteriota bacterium]
MAVIVGIMPFLYSAPLSAQASEAPGKVVATIPGSQSPVQDDKIFKHVLLDQFEGRTNGANNELRWDGEAWAGTDMNRLWLKSEGFASASGVSDGDQEFLYDRPISRLKYFDAQAGVRADLDSGPARAWAAIGIEGLAPYYFEFAPTLYIRNDGHVAGRITGFYDLLFTQRLIAEPEAELNFYSKDDAARGIGSGLSELDTGVRLRYEFSRKFAPYAGFAYTGRYGNTASYARRAEEDASNSSFIFGLRLWY